VGVTADMVTLRRPTDALFLRRMGVRPTSRAQGMGARFMALPPASPGAVCGHAFETCLPPSKQAGYGLLRHVAERLGAERTREPCLAASRLPEPGHEDEAFVRVGPYDPAKTNAFLRQEVESWK